MGRLDGYTMQIAWHKCEVLVSMVLNVVSGYDLVSKASFSVGEPVKKLKDTGPAATTRVRQAGSERGSRRVKVPARLRGQREECV